MSPAEFTFTDWNNRPQTFRLVGWRSDRAALLLLDKTNGRNVLNLEAPVTLRVPEPLPVSAGKARLLPPPCYPSDAEASVVKNFASSDGCRQATNYDTALEAFVEQASAAGLRHYQIPEGWKMVYGDALAPVSSDWPKLKKELANYCSCKRAEYDRYTAELNQLNLPENEFDKRVEIINGRFTSFLSAGHGRDKTTWIWEATLDDVKYTGGPFRHMLEKLLTDRWARECDFDLEEMKREAEHFRRAELGGPRHFDREQVALASVRYVLTFPDKSKVWLSQCSLRPVATTTESAEFDALLSGHPEFLRLTLPEAEKLLDIAPDPKHRTLKAYCSWAGLDYRHLTHASLPQLRDARRARKEKRGEGMRAHNRAKEREAR